MSSEWSIPGINLDLSLGPLFLAHCFNWCLYGLLCLQVFMFYASFPRDALHSKLLVYIVFFLDTVSIGLATYSGYWIFVTNWGNRPVFHELGWSWSTVPASSGFIALIVQAYFAHKIYIISKKWYMPAFILLLSTTACAFSFAAAAEVARLQAFSYIRHLNPSIWLSFGIASDFFVCVSLCYYLLTSRGGMKNGFRNGFNGTNRIIVRLVRISIETALVTMVAASIKLYLIFSRHDNMHLLFCLLLSRLYSNALLGTLNSRSPIFGGSHGLDSVRRNSDSAHIWSAGPGESFGSVKSPIHFASNRVMITKTTESDYEAGLVSEASGDEQYLPLSAMVPTYPVSPMAPAYSGQTSKAPSYRSLNTASPVSSPPPTCEKFQHQDEPSS